MLVARPLSELIRKQQELARVPQPHATESEVQAAIDRCADRLKSVAVERRVTNKACPPLYPDRRAIQDTTGGESLSQRIRAQIDRLKTQLVATEESLDDVIVTQQRYVDSQWERNKLDLVPGDDLLDAVCREFGFRFKKSRDSSRLASLFQPDEIHSDLKTFLATVTQ